MLSVRRAWISRDPDALDDPKRHLLDLARRSRRPAVREALLPSPGGTARVGPGYAAALIDFATRRWRPDVAERSSESLARLRAFLRARRPAKAPP